MSFKASSAEHQGGKPESSEARQPSDRVASVFLKSIDVTTLGFLPSSTNTSTSPLNHRRLLRKSISAFHTTPQNTHNVRKHTRIHPHAPRSPQRPSNKKTRPLPSKQTIRTPRTPLRLSRKSHQLHHFLKKHFFLITTRNRSQRARLQRWSR